MGQRSNFQQGPMEMKFDMDDPYGILSMLEILLRSFKVIKGSLWCHFRLIQNTPVDLKFHMNDLHVNLNMLK